MTRRALTLRGHGAWFSSDGMHLTPTGRKAYAAFIDPRTC